MKKRIFPALLLALLFSACGPLRYFQPNVAPGGRAVSITRHPLNNTQFLVASETGGLFKSTNSGTNWKQVSRDATFGFTDVKYYPANPSILIATALNDTKVTTGGGVYRSTNDGENWSQVTLSPPAAGCGAQLSAYCVAMEPGNNRIWVGTSCGLAFSTDNGASFNYLPAVTNYNNDVVYAVLTPQQDQIKILTDGGVKVSTDGGASWSYSTTGLPYMLKGNHAQIVCSPLNHQHIYWATNFAPGDGKWHNGIYYSTNNGNTWTNLIDNVGINRPPSCYIAMALSGDANKFDLYYSDGGCTLQRATFTNGTPPVMGGSWANLNHPHCDFADMVFKTDGKSPALLAGDGGLFSTSDNGANWVFTGGGVNGYNALQITEVTGQLHSADNKSDLYYATQDNNISSSPDGGTTWPPANTFCCEGFFLNIPRKNLPAAETKFTGVDCGACFNFMTGPLLSGGVGGFPNVPNATNAPRLLKPGAYVQSDTLPGAPTVSIFSLTTNNGGSWTQKYAFTNEQRDFSQVAGDSDDPTIFTAVRYSGSTPDGHEIVRIKRITGVLSGMSPIVSDVTGFGSLGIFPTMFAWYKPFGADVHNPNHLIIPDITTDQVVVTHDGGITWTTDLNLTNLVTQGGVFKFRSGAFTQISNIAFDPDVPGRILVGTVQAGIFQSCDNGRNWAKIEESQLVPYVSSFYFTGNNQAVVSSYGRGLWLVDLKTCPAVTFPKPDLQLSEPLIYWKGGLVPIRDIDNPDVCPVCRFILADKGDIVQVLINRENQVVERVGISGGSLRGYDMQIKPVQEFSFQMETMSGEFDTGKDEQLAGLLKSGYRVKGIFMEGKQFKGYILSREDITVDQLPSGKRNKNTLRADLVMDKTGNAMVGFKLRGSGFVKARVTVFVDGQEVKDKEGKPSFDDQGNMDYTLNIPLTPGGHTILVEQDSQNGKIREVTTLMVPLIEGDRIQR